MELDSSLWCPVKGQEATSTNKNTVEIPFKTKEKKITMRVQLEKCPGFSQDRVNFLPMPREAIESLSVEIFKTQLHAVLSNLLQVTPL